MIVTIMYQGAITGTVFLYDKIINMKKVLYQEYKYIKQSNSYLIIQIILESLSKSPSEQHVDFPHIKKSDMVVRKYTGTF